MVLPTRTWQAYNLRDEDGDGNGDSWYAGRRDEDGATRAALPEPRRARSRPAVRPAVPAWLAPHAGREVDVLAQCDLESAPRAQRWAAAYDLMVFPGHHEYVTRASTTSSRGSAIWAGTSAFFRANNYF